MLDAVEKVLVVPRIDAPCVRLRPFAAYDIGLIEEASQDAIIPLISTVPEKFSWNDGLDYVKQQHDQADQGAGYSMAIADHRHDRAIGQIGLSFDDTDRCRATLNYWIVRSGRGAGRATEALQALSDWAFASLSLQRLSLFIEPWDVASIKTAERAGYKNEGLLSRWTVIDGEVRDMMIFGRFRP